MLNEEAEKRELLGGKSTLLPFSVNALKVVAKRYLIRTHSGEVTETPEQMFERVAKALAAVELQYGASQSDVVALAKEFYDVMAGFAFTPAGRTLANAGGPTRLVSNCIVLHIEDSMESIFQTLKEASLLQKAGSGLGFPLHLMRPAGFITKTSYGIASGPVSFLQVYNAAFGVIKQQNRHGANMAVMRVDHPDILEFVHCKDREGDLRNFNVSVGLTDRFMQAVQSNDPSPWQCEFNGERMLPRRIRRNDSFAFVSATPVQIAARQLFDEILKSAWQTGEPGCVFLDAVNANNPLPGLGRIEACNPCGEQFLHDGDVCNLGSVNLEKMVRPNSTEENGQTVDWDRLRHTTRLAVQMLDNVIDLSDFPVDRVNAVFRGNRRVGLGVMGFADMLYQLRVPYNSDQGRQIAEQVMAFVQRTGHEMSRELAQRKGLFPNYAKSVFAAQQIPMRNAAITNVPPTGTISMMYDVSGGVEPYFALAYHYKNVLGGEQLSYVNKHLRRALDDAGVFSPQLLEEICRRGTLQHITSLPAWLRSTFVTAMDISARDHILMQAAFQRHCDNAISKTINFPASATRDDILVGYLTAWQHGCKGCTVYRDGSRNEQVLNLNASVDASTASTTAVAAPRSTVAAASEDNVSIAAVSNALPSELIRVPDTTEPSKHTLVGSKQLVERSGSHSEELTGKKRRVYASPQPCPDCSAMLVRQEGCAMCHACGYSKCAL